MNEFLNLILKETSIPSYYLQRPSDNVYPCIVYNFNELQGYSGDNKEETIKYDVYINLYTKYNLTTNTQKIKEVLDKNYFIKQSINSPIVLNDENQGENIYQIVFNYIKLRKEV